MPAPYNLSFLDNTTNLLDIAQGVHTNSDGYFIPLVLLFSYLVFYMAFSKFEAKSAFLGSGFIVALMAMTASVGGLVPTWVVITTIVIFLISLLVKLMWDG